MDNKEQQVIIEEGKELHLDFTKCKNFFHMETAIVPVVVQNAVTNEVLLLAYTNQEAFEQSLFEQKAIFWSTSRNKLWIKGSQSGDYLDLVEALVNCEQNSLLYRVIPRTGGVCHTADEKGQNRITCFYRRIKRNEKPFIELEFFKKTEIENRKK